jgi:chromosome segregation ATPase
MAGEKTVEEKLEELQSQMEKLTQEAETFRLENEKLRSDKGDLLKEAKKAKADRDAARQAQMTDEEKVKADLAKLATLEQENESLKKSQLRQEVILKHADGLPKLLLPLVQGDTDEEMISSIKSLKEQADEFVKSAGGTPQASAPEPPAPAGGRKPTVPSAKDIRKMTPEEFADFDKAIRNGEIELPFE